MLITSAWSFQPLNLPNLYGDSYTNSLEVTTILHLVNFILKFFYRFEI